MVEQVEERDPDIRDSKEWKGAGKGENGFFPLKNNEDSMNINSFGDSEEESAREKHSVPKEMPSQEKAFGMR